MRVDPEIDRARKFARLMDHYMLDPILGAFLPGAGDLIGSLLGFYVISMAVRRRLSPVIVARMLMNLALDAGLGIVPILGDAADFAFKAHEKNLGLLEARHQTGRATARDWAALIGAALAFLLVLGVAIYAVVRIVSALARGLP